MTKYSFILLKGEKEKLLERLADAGLVDITRSRKPIDSVSEELMNDIYLMEGLIHGLEAVEIPEGTVPETVQDEIVRLSGDLLMRHEDCLAKIREAEKEISTLKNWGDFDKEVFSELEAAGVPLHFHRLPRKQFREEWKTEAAIMTLPDSGPETYFVVAGEDSLPGEIQAPARSLGSAVQELEALHAEREGLLGKIAGAKLAIPELRSRIAASYAELDLYLAGAAAVSAAEDSIDTLVGYAPTEYDAKVLSVLDDAGVFYLKEEAKVQDNPPIEFKNNKFVKMFEVLTDMYGRPAYDGFDPTPFISVFFLLFFAFCMGDAGYGLLLLLVGLALKKADGFRSMAPLVTTLGIATTVLGFFFHTFFSLDISKWQIFAPVKGIFLPEHIFGLESFDAAMVAAILVGIVHICLAMVVKTASQTRSRGFLASLSTWGWTLLIVGGVIVGGISLAGVISSRVTRWAIIVIGVLSAMGIFLFNDIHRNPLVNIGSGLWETYNTATGLLGDVLSYLRLYALGLAGAKLGEAFNAIGTMVLGDGTSAFAWAGFLLIIIIGHTLNLAMCALGAFVHPLRLNFLEFFKNSGYEASGSIYNPLGKNNK